MEGRQGGGKEREGGEEREGDGEEREMCGIVLYRKGRLIEVNRQARCWNGCKGVGKWIFGGEELL